MRTQVHGALKDPIEELLESAFGYGRAEVHAHKCIECGNIWRHSESDMRTTAEHRAGHTCKCGRQQYWKFDEENDRDY